MNLREVDSRVVPAVECDLADKGLLLCGCQAGLRQEGCLGIGVGPAGRGGRNPRPLSLLFRGVETPAPQGWIQQGAGEGKLWASLGCRAQSEDPGSLAPESAAPHHPCSRAPSGPAVKPVNYSQGLSSPWWAGEGGRAPSLTSGKLDPTQGGSGWWPWAMAMASCRRSRRAGWPRGRAQLMSGCTLGCQKGLEAAGTPCTHLPTPPPVYPGLLGKSSQRQRNCHVDLRGCCSVGTLPLSSLQKEGP